MILIGLTGGVGMGKSTSADLLLARGVPVIDTDHLAREVVRAGEPALGEIRQEFGDEVIREDGQLNREAMARIVFSDDTKRQRLEAIVHPRIRQRWQAEADRWRASGIAGGVVVIPLLFETGAASAFDAVVCVACLSASQRRRLEARGWTGEQIEQRIAAQWPVQKKMDLSRFVIWTEPSVEVHREQLDRVLDRLRSL